jgi:Protein involved in biosynthesis of mitomycin antibiotics/polyketide fumonisin|tara:strand:- start:2257 stop:2901 length:645 start_codon:yes stop_codon:yes gene_type:complete
MEQGYRIIDIDITPFTKGFLSRLSYLVGKPIDSLDDYHDSVTDEEHQRITIPDRWMILNDDMVREIRKSTGLSGDLKADNLTLNSTQDYDICSWFIVRPKPHKDFITKLHSDKDNLGSTYNIWIPLSGFGKEYSLSIVPNSHKEDNTVQSYRVGNDVAYYNRLPDNDNCIRPDLKRGQGILFDSNLIHGNAYNKGTVTRSSLEVRFYENSICNS